MAADRRIKEIMADTTHGNKTAWPHRPDSERWPGMSIRKVDARSVPYGESVSRNGGTCYAAYHDGQLIAVAGTSAEARSKYREFAIADGAKRAAEKRAEGDS